MWSRYVLNASVLGAYVQIVVRNLSYVKFPFKTVVMRRLYRLLFDRNCLYITITLRWSCVRALSRVALPNLVMQRISDTRQ